MKFLQQLREKDPSSPVAFHLEGILDAASNVQAHLTKLGEMPDLTHESTAEALVDLQVEIYSHLAYHMKMLRRPLLRLEKNICEELEREEGEYDEP